MKQVRFTVDLQAVGVHVKLCTARKGTNSNILMVYQADPPENGERCCWLVIVDEPRTAHGVMCISPRRGKVFRGLLKDEVEESHPGTLEGLLGVEAVLLVQLYNSRFVRGDG